MANTLLATLPKAGYLLGDTAYDGDLLRAFLAERGTTAVIKPNPTRKNVPAFDKAIYKLRNLVERAFSHLKDWPPCGNTIRQACQEFRRNRRPRSYYHLVGVN